MEDLQIFAQIRSIHAPLAGLTFLLVIISDFYGFLWIIGKLKNLKLNVLVWMHKLVFIGLFGLIATGLSMLYFNHEFFTNYIFFIKMFFVLVLFLNAFRIGAEMTIPARKTFKELTKKEKKKMLSVGLTSFVSWVSVLFLAGNL